MQCCIKNFAVRGFFLWRKPTQLVLLKLIYYTQPPSRWQPLTPQSARGRTVTVRCTCECDRVRNIFFFYQQLKKAFRKWRLCGCSSHLVVMLLCFAISINLNSILFICTCVKGLFRASLFIYESVTCFLRKNSTKFFIFCS